MLSLRTTKTTRLKTQMRIHLSINFRCKMQIWGNNILAACETRIREHCPVDDMENRYKSMQHRKKSVLQCVFRRSFSPPYCSDHLLYFPLWLQPCSLLLGSATAAICPRCNPPVTRSTAVVTICTGQQQAWKAHFLCCVVQLPPRVGSKCFQSIF